MATSDNDDDRGPISSRVNRFIDTEFWPVVIGFLFGRAWVELPETIAGKVETVVSTTATFALLLAIVGLVLVVAFVGAIWVYGRFK